MNLLKTIDNNSCTDRKLYVAILQNEKEHDLDCYAATAINTTTNKDLSIYTEHDEHIVTLLPRQSFELVQESTSKTFGRIKVKITDTAETTEPTTETGTVTMKTHGQRFTTGALETEKTFNLTSIFDEDKIYVTTLWKYYDGDWFIITTGSISGETESYENLINFNSVLVLDHERIFTFSNLEASTAYRYAIIQIDDNTSVEAVAN